MEKVHTRYHHSTQSARYLLIAILACALAGCWEEIHYTPPPKAETESADFADEVETSLAEDAQPTPTGETASAVGEPAGTPTTSPDMAPVAPAPDPARSPRRMAWLLGSNLSLAALANDRAAAEEKVADWFDKSRRLAQLLGTTVAYLPPRPAAGEARPRADRAIEYLFERGQEIGRHLATEHGDDHAALFELALKSNILIVLYRPEAPVVASLSTAIERSGERAQLPPELWQPLLKMLDQGAPAKEVRDAVFQMHVDVDRYLSAPQP